MECLDYSVNKGSSSSSDEHIPTCVKLSWPQNISSYYEGHEPEGDTEQLESDNKVIENVINNYIIVKRIVSNLDWRDKLVCQYVSNTWCSAVQALRREQLNPIDFMLHLQLIRMRNIINYIQSDNLNIEPLAVFTFSNTRFNLSKKCMIMSPTPCDPPCEEKHSILDYIQHIVSSPRDCMVSAKASYLSYRPLPHSVTSEYTIKTHDRVYPFFCGVYIPAIPDVKFHVISIKSGTDMQKEFYDVVANLAQENIFKGVLIYVTENLLLHSSAEKYSYLNYFKEVQPDIPYALAGCLVDEVVCEASETNNIIESINQNQDTVSENLVTVAMFTVPKQIIGAGHIDKSNNFDMYSLVIEIYFSNKQRIQAVIKEFSKKVPRFQHSIALKLSCIGRDKKHKMEEELFRNEFPTTRLIGCYGNGELGINHPELDFSDLTPPLKRFKLNESVLKILHSYATVILYIGWGKITSPHGPL